MMMENLLTLLPTPMMLPPMIVGVSPEGIVEGLDEPSLWSVPTEAPVVAVGFEPEVDPAGCVPLPSGDTPALGWPIAQGCPIAPGGPGLLVPFSTSAEGPLTQGWGRCRVWLDL